MNSYDSIISELDKIKVSSHRKIAKKKLRQILEKFVGILKKKKFEDTRLMSFNGDYALTDHKTYVIIINRDREVKWKIIETIPLIVNNENVRKVIEGYIIDISNKISKAIKNAD